MNEVLLALAGDPGSAAILASGSGDGAVGLAIPFVAGPGVFVGVYYAIYRYYRNTDKRHEYERETEVSVGNLQAGDHRRGSKNRQRNRTMNGANEDDHLQRVRRIDVR